jgi:Holliday junction resolvase RusA-like endonuclease
LVARIWHCVGCGVLHGYGRNHREGDMSVRVTFDPPPSANRLWRSVRGRVIKAPAYARWIGAAAWMVRTSMRGRNSALQGDLAATVKIPRKHKGRDLDNCIKPCFDALQAGGAIENDRQIVRFTAAWVEKTVPHVEIELFEVEVS